MTVTRIRPPPVHFHQTLSGGFLAGAKLAGAGGGADGASALGKAFMSLSQVWLSSIFYLFLLSRTHPSAYSSSAGCCWDTSGAVTPSLP